MTQITSPTTRTLPAQTTIASPFASSNQTSLPLLNKVKQVVDAHFKESFEITPLSTNSNDVFLCTSLRQKVIFKLYPQGKLHEDVEPWLHQKLGNTPCLRQCYWTDASKTLFPHTFSVLEYVDGKTLHEISEENDPNEIGMRRLAAQKVFNFFQSVTAQKMEGCGFINSEGKTSHKDWPTFILDYLTPSVVSLMQQGRHLDCCQKVYATILERNKELLRINDFSLVPVDLKLNSLLMEPNNKLVVLNGAVVSADPAFGYAKFIRHTYNTPFYEPFDNMLKENSHYRETKDLYGMIFDLKDLADTACDAQSSKNLEDSIETRIGFLKPKVPVSNFDFSGFRKITGIDLR